MRYFSQGAVQGSVLVVVVAFCLLAVCFSIGLEPLSIYLLLFVDACHSIPFDGAGVMQCILARGSFSITHLCCLVSISWTLSQLGTFDSLG